LDEAATIALIAAIVLGLFLCGGALIVARGQPEFAGHPRGLYMLFFAEMWERFSYYGMRALLIFYLTKHWLFSDADAAGIYGAYTALVYITPVLGGWLADRYLGQRKAVLFGAVLLTIGHGLMAFEGTGGQSDPTINIFWAALSFIIVGSGFLKANISTIVGQLYPRTDLRRDGAYTIFYMGINLGAATGVILAGWLGETYGWAYGFGAAGIGMLLGLIVFVVLKPWLMGRGEAPDSVALARPVGGVKLEWWLYAIGLAAIAVTWLLIQREAVVGWLLLAGGAILFGYVLLEAQKLDREARERIWAIMFLIALQPVFWGLFEQAGGSLSLFTDRYVDRQGVPASLFQSINPIYIILLGPLFAALWTWLGRRGMEPSTPAKFGLALVQMGLAFIVLVVGANLAGPDALVPVLFIFLLYLLATTGELCLSPVGLSAMNRLAPAAMASLIMGAWFYASAGGNFVAGLIGRATGGEDGAMTREAAISVYQAIGWIAIGVGVLVLVLSPLVRRWMHLATLKDDVPAGLEPEGLDRALVAKGQA
jgi:POT family proton-dependent oligopeptide transporter